MSTSTPPASATPVPTASAEPRPASSLDAVTPEELEAMLRQLRLPAFRTHLATLVTEAEQSGMSYRSFLALLCAEELAQRQHQRLQRAVRAAQFPELVTIDELDFGFQKSIRLRQLGRLLGPELVTDGRCAIFLGSPGNAKTALCIALAYQAIQHGFTARFTPAHALISALARAAKEDRFEAALTEYVEPAVLCIDEIGYLTLPEQDAANVLYRVVDQRYQQKKAMLVTTNKPLAAWGQVLHDGDLAGAIIDRILARGALYELKGLSYRTRHIPPDQLGLAPPPMPTRTPERRSASTEDVA